MPVHDWTKVDANAFHHFHQAWTMSICNALNAGLLPPGFSALVEQHAGGIVPMFWLWRGDLGSAIFSEVL
jgi:hypothetical protein